MAFIKEPITITINDQHSTSISAAVAAEVTSLMSDSSTGGYQCSGCGKQVWDYHHECQPKQPDIYFPPMALTPVIDNVALGRIADALERIAAVLEADA